MLGVCCQWMIERTKRNGHVELVNSLKQHDLQHGRFRKGAYTAEHIVQTYVSNITSILTNLRNIRHAGCRMFRLSSTLLPLWDVVDRDLWDRPEVIVRLEQLGNEMRLYDMRVTVHPGQFCVLSSDTDTVVLTSIRELELHAWMFDTMGFPATTHHAINIHGGKSKRSSRLIDVINSLPVNVKSRLTLENDESSYSLVDLVKVHQATGVPIVWDSHHHTFNDGGIDADDACAICIETWPIGMRPLQHISNSEPDYVNGTYHQRRKHSRMIHYVSTCQLERLREGTLDVDVEATHKNIAVFAMAREFNIVSDYACNN